MTFTHRTDRRTFAAIASGVVAGVFAASHPGAAAQSGTPPDVPTPVGFASTRVRTVEFAGQREAVNDRVMDGFIHAVQALDGYAGYLLGDVVDAPEQSLSILALDDASHQDGFDDLAAEFVDGVEDEVTTVDTKAWAGGRRHPVHPPAPVR